MYCNRLTHRLCDYWFVSTNLILSTLMCVSKGGHRLVSMIFILMFTWTLIMMLLVYINVYVYVYLFLHAYEFWSQFE